MKLVKSLLIIASLTSLISCQKPTNLTTASCIISFQLDSKCNNKCQDDYVQKCQSDQSEVYKSSECTSYESAKPADNDQEWTDDLIKKYQLCHDKCLQAIQQENKEQISALYKCGGVQNTTCKSPTDKDDSCQECKEGLAKNSEKKCVPKDEIPVEKSSNSSLLIYLALINLIVLLLIA